MEWGGLFDQYWVDKKWFELIMKAMGNGFAGINDVGLRGENDEVGEWKVEGWKECMNVEQSFVLHFNYFVMSCQVDEQWALEH